MNVLSLKVKIIEEKDNEIVGQVVKKEALTYPDPKVGENYSFFGNYDKGQFQMGQTVIIRSEYLSPNLRKDPNRIDMTIVRIEPDHFDPGGADLDVTLIGGLLFAIFFVAIFLTKILKKK